MLGIGSKIDDSVNQSAMLLSWGITILLVFLFLDYWGEFEFYKWEEAMDEGTFVIAVGIFFFAVLLSAYFIVQPFIYALVYAELESQQADEASYKSYS